jgi:glycosyltransferase involved in cell wall biosynthesis
MRNAGSLDEHFSRRGYLLETCRVSLSDGGEGGRALRIAMVGDLDEPALLPGAPSRMESLAGALARLGHQVTVYTRDVGRRLNRPRRAVGYRLVTVPAGPLSPLPVDECVPFMGEFAGFLDNEWRANRPDVAHAYSWHYGLATQLAADSNAVPTVQGFRPSSMSVRRVDSGKHTVESLLAKKAAAIASDCTETMLAHLRLGAARSKTTVLARGVDVATFAPADGHIEGGLRRVTVMAPDLSTRHGADVAIRALRGVPGAELAILGDGDATALRRAVDEMGLTDRVHFAPMVSYDEVPEMLTTAGVVACIPHSEPYGTIVLEAMAAGVPVIASAAGELLDIVIHDVTGLLVNPGDVPALTRSMKTMFEDPFRRQGMGFAARTRIRSRYSWDRVAADALMVYSKAQGRQQAAARVTVSK